MSFEMNPHEITIAPNGTLTLPLGLLAQAGIDPGATLVATSPSDGRIILRRFDDVAEDLLRGLPPI